MKSVGVIPARYASTRFPGKPLVYIAGKTLIRRVYEQSMQSGLDRIIVATDDMRIMDEVISFGGEAVMTGEHMSGTDRIAEAVRTIDCDIVVNIQGDEPLIDPASIDTVSRVIASAKADVSTAAILIRTENDIDNPNIVKVVLDKNSYALYFSRSRIPYNRSGNPLYYKHIGLYAYSRDFLFRYISLESSLEKAESLEQLRVIENGFRIHVSVIESDSVGVDLPEDVKRVESIITNC